MLFNQLILTLLTEESCPFLDTVLTEMIKIHHPVLLIATESSSTALTQFSPLSSPSIARSSTSHELLALIKQRLLKILRLILKNLVIPVQEDAIYSDLASKLQIESMQKSAMAQETARLDHSVQLAYFSCQESFREYLASLKTHFNDYLIPHKNSLDRKLSFEYLVRAQLMENDKKMLTTKRALQLCPNRDEAKKRMDKYKEMQDKISTLTGKILESKGRLHQFKSIDLRLIKKLKQVHDELVEKKWAAEQLGCLSFADTSTF